MRTLFLNQLQVFFAPSCFVSSVLLKGLGVEVGVGFFSILIAVCLFCLFVLLCVSVLYYFSLFKCSS